MCVVIGEGDGPNVRDSVPGTDPRIVTPGGKGRGKRAVVRFPRSIKRGV
jgi:hypothetical protein